MSYQTGKLYKNIITDETFLLLKIEECKKHRAAFAPCSCGYSACPGRLIFVGSEELICGYDKLNFEYIEVFKEVI